MAYKDGWDLDLGAVMTYIISPTRALLVKDLSFPHPLWKLAGGKVEPEDLSIVVAAIREAKEETGIQLLPEELVFYTNQRRKNGVYYPFFFVASVSEQKLDTRHEVTDEDGKAMETGIFERTKVSTMPNLLGKHRLFVREIEVG